jgi:hypothetical protein
MWNQSQKVRSAPELSGGQRPRASVLANTQFTDQTFTFVHDLPSHKEETLKTKLFGRFLRGGLTTVVLLAGLIASAIPAHAGTGTSGYCNDDVGGEVEIPIITDPITLAVEIGTNDQFAHPVHAGICYSTTREGYTGSELTGGFISIDADPQGSNPFAGFGCVPDDNTQGAEVNCNVRTTPTYTVNQGGANGGQVITVSIPFSVCVGQCVNDALNTTGLIVGTIAQQPSGGTSAAYQLSSLCAYVDGIQVSPACSNGILSTGVTTTGASPTNINSQGPCVLEQCLPLFGTSYVGTTGNQLATIWIAGIAIPLYGEHTCAYNADAGTPCPY